MKAKTFIELAALSASLYAISKKADILEKMKDLSEQGSEKINEFMSEKIIDEHGNEMLFTDRLLLKAKEARGELESKINEMVAAYYEKLKITENSQLAELENKLEQLNKNIALAEARIHKLENNSGTDGAV